MVHLLTSFTLEDVRKVQCNQNLIKNLMVVMQIVMMMDKIAETVACHSVTKQAFQHAQHSTGKTFYP
jgi:hypothetical protein